LFSRAATVAAATVVALGAGTVLATPAEAGVRGTYYAETHYGGGSDSTAILWFFSDYDEFLLIDNAADGWGVVGHIQYRSGNSWRDWNRNLYYGGGAAGDGLTKRYNFATGQQIRFSVALQNGPNGNRVGGEGWVYARA
jgi:hypothetical protein